MNLYVNSMTDFTIVDDDNKEYTPEQAKKLCEEGKVQGCNMAFRNLEMHDFSIEALRDYYEELKKPEVA